MKAKKGSTVKIDYHGISKDTKYTISTNEQGPVKFKVGAGSVPVGLEKGVIGMEAGEKKKISLIPEEGFGKRKYDFVTKINKNRIPENVDPKIGQKFQFKTSKGGLKEVYVADIQKDIITLDANHPLAGRTVELELKMLEID